MICPHCLVGFHPSTEIIYLGSDKEGDWGIFKDLCPECEKIICILFRGNAIFEPDGEFMDFKDYYDSTLVYPRGSNRPPVPSEVPEKFAGDYKEACLILNDSPKASAALSRRCLQHLLREKAEVKPGNLVDEIEQVIKSGNLPSGLADAIDAIRNIGNFATHPIKSKSTGEIVPVEPGEAEWTLDVLESLFNFYFVQPEVLKRKREALNKKLKNAGKKPMKGKK